jgi:hypothetical protein
MLNKYYNFEIYTIDPITGTTGWDIHMVSVKAQTLLEARTNLKDYPNFDCVILYNFSHSEDESADFLVTESYPEFKILNRIQSNPTMF